MKNLSLIYCARNDSYGDDYNCREFNRRDLKKFKKFNINKYNNIERIKTTLEKNILLLDKYFPDNYEIIFVDWSPLSKDKYLINSDETKEIFKNKNIKNIIITPETIEKKGLNRKGFYEYYGKNIGIRNSNSKYILISNPDDIFQEKLILNLKNKIENNQDDNFYGRCYSRLDVDHDLNTIAEGFSFPKNGKKNDEIIGTPASGDFLLASKENLIRSTGYYEEFSKGNQTMLDGKLCIKLYNMKLKPVLIEGSIMHLHHKKHDRSGNHNIWTDDYKNGEYWGFKDFEIKELNNNSFII